VAEGIAEDGSLILLQQAVGASPPMTRKLRAADIVHVR
jgi:hypothetical protein